MKEENNLKRRIMPDDVIKNPARKERLIEPYEPEYKRLNREPEIKEVKVYDFQNRKGKSPKRIVDEEPQQILPQSLDGNVPQQTHVFVGQNNNWFDSGPKSIVNEIEKTVNDLVEKTEEAVIENNAEPSIPRISDVEAGNYCLFIKGDIIAISESKDSLVNFVESILFDNDPKFKDITVNDLLLVKRLHLKVGVLAMD